jgi:NAD(P)H dehydrogenase (quinone)
LTKIAVTGASGRLGGHVIRLLARQAAVDLIAVSRSPTTVPERVIARTADYADRDALRRCLSGVDTLIFVSSDGEATKVLAHHLNVIAAARECGVRHIVALSSVDADVDSPFCYAVTNALTEQAIRDSGCGFSIIRASIFTEFFCSFLLPARTTGEISLPVVNGRVGLVSRVDVGSCLAAFACLEPTGLSHDITGPQALDGVAMAAICAEVWGRPVTYRSIGAAEHMAQLATTEDPWWTYAYTSMFASIREQRWNRVTSEVHDITGRPPRSLSEVLLA